MPSSTLQTLVVSTMLKKLDFDNALLVRFTVYFIPRRQSVQNTSARLIYRLCRSDHISDSLVSLHWLLVPKRIEYKIAVLGRIVLKSAE